MIYDLENRTLGFAKRVAAFLNIVPKGITNFEYCKQVTRSSGSVGANYIEANESLGKKDFLLHIKISRKEAKETRYWLELISCNQDQGKEKAALIQESIELMKIFGSIITKKE